MTRKRGFDHANGFAVTGGSWCYCAFDWRLDSNVGR